MMYFAISTNANVLIGTDSLGEMWQSLCMNEPALPYIAGVWEEDDDGNMLRTWHSE